nr:glycine zipper 2TM domain-containing protein [Oleiagrimonas sp. C23AA]
MFNNNSRWQLLCIAIVSGVMLSLAGCATNGYGNTGTRYGTQYGGGGAPARCNNCGTVQSVRQVYVQKDSSTLGTVIGALAGAALGNTVGKGDGRQAATVAGAVAGGAAGHEIGKRSGNQVPAYQVVVRMDNGRTATVTQRDDPRVRRGDYVQVRDGHVYLQ